jgi:proliferating cell nuclear antigen
MRIKLDNPVLLSKAVELISELVTEVRLKVSEFGLNITAIDPANVSMVGFKLPKSAFSEFESGYEVLGVNLDDLKKILKRAKNGSSLILSKNENMLEISIQDKIKRNFTLNLIEIESEDIDFSEKVSRMEFSSRVEINSQDLIDSIDDCAVVADSCSFSIKEGKFVIKAKGINSTQSDFSGDEAKIEAEDCTAKYSLEYLQKFIKASKLTEKTNLSFANDHPLRFDVNANPLGISFILAPRVETED